MMDFKKTLTASMDRRKLLGNLGLLGAGTLLTACGVQAAPPIDTPEPIEPTNYDPAILNFALNLEYLEAAFYLAAVGRISEIRNLGGDAEIMLPAGFDGTIAMNFGEGAMGAALRNFAEELADEELAHTVFLRNALQGAGAPVADRPVLNLSSSFMAAASAALAPIPEGSRPFQGSDFNPFANGAFFAHGAFIFEDVGVTAYKGAARFLTNPDFLEAAAGILASEAYHSGMIRTYLYLADASVLDFYGGLPTHAIVGAISDARDSLDGSGDKDQGIADVDIVTGGEANIAVTDNNGIAFSRTPIEVARIVALSPEAQFTANSFFPNGITVPEALAEDFSDLLNPDFPNNLG